MSIISLSPTDSITRFSVSFEEVGTLEKDSVIEGWVEKVNGLWQGYTQSGLIGKPNSNPVEAAKLVINNYEKRAMRSLERVITNTENRVESYPDGSALRGGAQRLLDGLKARLAAGDY